MKKFWTDHKEKITDFILCGGIFIGVLSVLALISGAVMRLFGFQYESIGSMLLFFIIATAISFPFNLIAGALPRAWFERGKMNGRYAFAIYLILDTVATSLGLKIVDHFMTSVSAATVSIVVVSFLLALPGKEHFSGKEEEK